MEAIDAMVESFYARVLVDPLLRPIFVDVARIDLATHLPRIKAYWGKLLLGQGDYRRNMVAQHQAIHARCALRSEEHTSELQSLMRISCAVCCLKKKKYPLKTTCITRRETT